MSSLLDKKVISDDKKFLVGLIIPFCFVLWLCSPPGNKFANVGYWINNLTYIASKVTHIGKIPEYKLHRNNAVYLSTANPKQPKRAMQEIDKAIEIIPISSTDYEKSDLLSDRAMIKLYYGDRKGALEDFLTAGEMSINKNLITSILLTEKRQYKMASEYCKNIISENYQAFAGYICMANVYETAGYKDVALRFLDLAIYNKPNSPTAYIERANLKKRMEDLEGAEADYKKAKELSPKDIDKNYSTIEHYSHPNRLLLSIK